jgi:tryptophan halogenase
MKNFDIVIFGGGTAGWFTAAGLVKLLSKKYKICVVESKEITKIGVGESVTPHVQDFFNKLGIDTHHWMKETGAVYKLANKFTGWVNGKDETEFFSFDYPTDIKNLFKDQTEITDPKKWAVNRNNLKTTDAFLKAYNDGYLNKFDRYFNSQYHYMVKNKAPFIGKDYTLNPCHSWSQHINAEKSGDYVKNFIAVPAGVEQIITNIIDIEIIDNKVKSIIDDQGNKISGKLFIDATGFHRKIASKMGWEFLSYNDMPIDRSLVVQLNYDDPKIELVNHTQSIAMKWGWIFKIGLYHRMGTGYCYSSSFARDDEILSNFLEINKNKRFDPRLIKWSPGRLKKLGDKNLVTIGLSSGFIEPLEANGLYILISGIYNLLDVLEDYELEKCNWDTFNEKMCYSLDDLKDFLKVHYTLSKRSDSSFWLEMSEIGKKENHQELVKSKYFNKLNSMEYANHNWTLFPDYMWMQLAISWGLDINSWLVKLKPEVVELATHYFKSRERKHDLISNLTMNNFEWLKKEIYNGMSPKDWENKL